MCDGNAGSTSDADVPDDENECTFDGCDEGYPSIGNDGTDDAWVIVDSAWINVYFTTTCD